MHPDGQPAVLSSSPADAGFVFNFAGLSKAAYTVGNMAGGDTVQQIKNKLSIQDVVGGYVKLKRAGRSIVGLCPFHKEKTPSFHVSVDRGTFHCFGCSVGGDMFSFIEKIEGVDFKGALKLLAEKAGVEIEYGNASREDKSRTERLREAMAKASQFYIEQLTKEGAGYAYAKKRGLSDETIIAWGIGFAPDGWRALLEALSLQGFTQAELAAVGLVKEADGKPGTWYDRFRNRLMFPIRDNSGRVVAFTGRTLSAEEQAKYLNSPETELYHKSDILFAMDKAKDAIRTRGFTLLMEGQMDTIHAHQAGFENTVALSGTALSEKHVALMKRYSENLMLCLDADSAGLAATAKSAIAALRAGLKVKAVRLPTGKDPADLITEDAKEFTKRVKEALPVVEFFLAVLAERERDPHRLVTISEKIVLPLIAAIQSPMEREHFATVTGRTLGLSAEAIKEALRRLPREEGAAIGGRAQGAEGKNAPTLSRQPPTSRARLLLAAIHAYPDTPLAKRVEAEYARITEAPPPSEPLPEQALFEAERAFGENPSENAADELLHAFEEAVIREAYQESVAELRRAEQSKDQAAIESAQALCTRLSAKLAKHRP